jgi:hypothetical protein
MPNTVFLDFPQNSFDCLASFQVREVINHYQLCMAALAFGKPSSASAPKANTSWDEIER